MPSGSRIVLRAAAEADIPTPDADQSALFMDADDANAPYWKDEFGTFHPLTGADGALTYLDHGNTGATETVDVQVATIQRLVANAATVTLTLSNPPGSGTPGIVRLWLEQDGVGGRDWAFPGSVEWGDAGEPVWTGRSAGHVDLVDLTTVDGGTTYLATVAGREGPPGTSDLDAIITASSGQDIADALAGADAPDAANVFATMADVGGGSGNLAGTELDYVQITSSVTVTGTAETSAGSTAVITGNSVAYDGSTIIDIEFYCCAAAPDPAAASRDLRIFVMEGTTYLGRIALLQQSVAGSTFQFVPLNPHLRITPTAGSHTYLIRAMRSGGDGSIQAGAGGATNNAPAFMRITRVSP